MSTDIEAELTFEQQKEITRILEGYRANPSNSNKFRYELFAYIDSILESQKANLLGVEKG